MCITQGTKSCVLVSHSACIWDIKNLSCEYMHDPSLACVARGCPGGVSFTTCSADGTIRLWDLVLQPESSQDLSSIAKDCSFGNTESAGPCLGNMFKRLYMVINRIFMPTNCTEFICLEIYLNLLLFCSLIISYPSVVSAGIFEQDSVMSGFSTQGFRAMAVSSEGKHLAAGDCEGNLHLYNLHTSEYIYIPVTYSPNLMSKSCAC